MWYDTSVFRMPERAKSSFKPKKKCLNDKESFALRGNQPYFDGIEKSFTLLVVSYENYCWSMPINEVLRDEAE